MPDALEINQGEAPLFSVLILCWNSNATIRACLRAVEQQTLKDFEVILVDNGSPEPLPAEIVKDFPALNIRYFPLKENLGFAGGNNYAAGLARGRYLALLNSDAFPQPDWLDVIRAALAIHPDCSFASRLIMANAPDRLDGEGDNYHASGVVWRRSYGRPVSRSAYAEREVFSACGAAAVYPRDAFEAAGGFDADYFAYTEDVDLGFRLRLAGISCIYLPAAVVRHVGSGSTGLRSDLSVYYGQRNLVWTFFKNMPGFLFVLLLPAHLLMNFGMILLSALRGQAGVAWRAKRDAFSGLGAVWKKRRAIQGRRKVSALALARLIDWNPISPLFKLLKR